MAEFQRYIGIDWSGAGQSDDRVALRVVEATGGDTPQPVRPPTSRRAKNWTRSEVGAFLRQVLHCDSPPTLVGIDAALGYPAGSATAIFGAEDWREMVATIAEWMNEAGDVRRFMNRVNARHAHRRGVPFFSRRSDVSERQWWREHHERHGFFTETGVAYHRLVDILTPQAISPFYMGPGAMVGGHTITCLETLAPLLEARDTDGALDFGVWPQESNWPQRRHVIAECYPAICPDIDGTSRDMSADERDATKIAAWLPGLTPGELQSLLTSLADNDGLQRLAMTEGWMLGVPAPASPALIENWCGSDE